VKSALQGKRQPVDSKGVTPRNDANVVAAETKLRRQLGTGVNIKKNTKGDGGKIEIEYYTDSDLDRIYQILMQQE
jgi:hypothetical protein